MKASYQVVPEKVIGYTSSNKSWEVVTLPDSNFGLFMQNYHILEVAILDVVGNKYTFYPYKHADALLNYKGSLQAWFDSIAGTALHTFTDGHPELEFATSHYQPLSITDEHTIGLAPPNIHPSQDFAVDDARDLVIQTTDEKMEQYNSRLLYSVDGLWVRDVAESYGMRLLGGGDIIRHGNGGNVSALVFNDIGEVRTQDLTESMVFKVDTEQSYYTALTIKTPESISGKTVGLVLAGRLFWIKLEDYLSDTSIRFSLANVDILSLLMETRDRYDWDVLGLGDFSSPTHVSRIRSDSIISGLFNHISSFLVIVDNPYIEQTYTSIPTRGATGRWRIVDEKGELTMGYLVNQLGTLVDYWPTWDRGVWTLYTKEYDFKHYLLNHSKWQRQSIVNDAIAIHEQPYLAPHLTMVNLKARKK